MNSMFSSSHKYVVPLTQSWRMQSNCFFEVFFNISEKNVHVLDWKKFKCIKLWSSDQKTVTLKFPQILKEQGQRIWSKLQFKVLKFHSFYDSSTINFITEMILFSEGCAAQHLKRLDFKDTFWSIRRKLIQEKTQCDKFRLHFCF